LIKLFGGLFLLSVLAVLGGLKAPSAVATPNHGKLLASGLQGTIGGTIGPDGALYVPEGTTGEITRIDPTTGAATTFAVGLTPAPFGGAIDVAFVGDTAYALVTLVEVSGIYRIEDDGPTLLADLGAFSADHLPPYPVDVPIGLQFALQPIEGGFLVSDGHHNRILYVTMAGDVTELISFGNIVPTGLEVTGGKIYMGRTGAIPHAPADGRVVSFGLTNPRAEDIASGYSLIVDVEAGPAGTLYALSQGDSPGEVPPASPAMPESGKLLRVNSNGSFTVLVDGLNLPTTLEFAGDTAYVVTLNGEVWKIDGVSKLDPAAPGLPISAPSTGDGGLLDQRSGSVATLTIVLASAIGAAAALTHRRMRQRV
jgi:sugar lactone lactonase YvrE